MLTSLLRHMVRGIPKRPHSVAGYGYNSMSSSTCRESRIYEVLHPQCCLCPFSGRAKGRCPSQYHHGVTERNSESRCRLAVYHLKVSPKVFFPLLSDACKVCLFAAAADG